jgi:uncharacterized protein YndB with AHSA1/START domain
MIEPLHLSVVVQCDAEHAFAVFTSKTSIWWPPSHSVSRQPGITVTFEPRLGGRIVERTSDSAEFDWGEILVWGPPRRLGYLWHLGSDRSQATEVQIEFVPLTDDSTRVDITHSGWERLGDLGPTRREKNSHGWGGMLPHYVSACAPR